MLITEQKRKKRLGNCPIGLFMFKGELCVKTEYWTNNKPDCYIISSGEYFCGGTTDVDIFLDLKVVPLNIDLHFFDKVQEAINIIEELNINEISKQGGISALKLILNNK